MTLKLNIGCGTDYKKGYINIDTNKNVKADRYIKDENQINYKNVNEIIANRVLPFLKDESKSLIKWHKMLKKGGKIKLLVPHFSSPPYSMEARRQFGYRIRDFYRFEKRIEWINIPKDLKYKVKIKIRLYKGFRIWNYLFEWAFNSSRFMQRFYEESLWHNLLPAGVMEVEMAK